MAEENTQKPNLPTRTVTITGERTSSMVALTIRMSQLEQKLINLSGSSSAQIRNAYNTSRSIAEKALAQMEESISEAMKAADVSSGRGRARTTRSENQKREAKNGSPNPAAQAPTGQKKPAKKTKPSKQAGTSGQAVAEATVKVEGAKSTVKPVPAATPNPSKDKISAVAGA